MVSISGISFSQNEYKKLGWLSLGLKILSHQVLGICMQPHSRGNVFTKEEVFRYEKKPSF